jgi:hypothetical protein
MIADGADYQSVCDATGLARKTVRKVAYKMRKAGIDVPIVQAKYEYTGENEIGQIVKFNSLSECNANNFNGALVSLCVNGRRETHAGYKWTRVER